MELSHESYRTRWLILVAAWAVAATAVVWQTVAVRDYLALSGKFGLRGAADINTPLKQTYPVFAADAQTWVRHALSLVEGHDLQLRHTTIDNAPVGREVHWNSAWAWAIAGAGYVYHLFTGQPIANSVEKATIWLTPITLLALIMIISAWVTSRAGVIAGVFLVVAMTCHDRVVEGFFPSYVDHHGLLTVAVLGTVLGGALMGTGFWKAREPGSIGLLPSSAEAARAAATFSAIAGACGMWVSAASVIPGIAIVGFSGLATILVQGRTVRDHGATFDPNAWRTWGRVGAVASMVFYLLEYFPRHLGLRMEVNHPFYALAWFGGAEIIAIIAERWLRPAGPRWSDLNARQHLWPVLAVLVAPAVILIGGAKVLSFSDPFMARLHSDYIQEFLPLWKTMRAFDSKLIFQVLVVDTSPLFAAVALLTYWRRESPVVLWFGTLAAGLLTAMGWWQTRWQLNASGGQICLALIVLICWAVAYRPLIRWLLAAAIVGLLYLPTGFIRVRGAMRDVKTNVVQARDATLPLARDIANALRASQPEGEITMLSSPNSSTMIGYYGRFKTLGTLYWENAAGLKSAAAIFSAPTEEAAARLIMQHRVTHIAIVSEENFIEQYYGLLHPGATPDQIRSGFGFKLFYQKVVPQWLQMIPYRVPDDLKLLKMEVMLFKVNFTQSLPEAIYNVALSQIALDAVDDADKSLDRLLEMAPQWNQPWLRKGEILIARHEWQKAAEAFLKGITLTPEADRPLLYENVAGAFYKQGQHGIAVHIYRTGLKERRMPNLACYLAWVLATSADDSLRNGKEALELAEEALKSDPKSPSYLNAYAGALAELGRFPEAIAACDRAIANARLRGEAAVAQSFEQRLAVLKSGKPLRI